MDAHEGQSTPGYAIPGIHERDEIIPQRLDVHIVQSVHSDGVLLGKI
jgi:hypothetical protein